MNNNSTHTAADLELARIGIEAMISFMAEELGVDEPTAFALIRANADSVKVRSLVAMTATALADAAAA